jgi:hypothetical protein
MAREYVPVISIPGVGYSGDARPRKSRQRVQIQQVEAAKGGVNWDLWVVSVANPDILIGVGIN